MRRAAMIVGLILILLPPSVARTQQQPPWWFSMEIGEGLLKLSSDQQQGDRNGNYAVGFAGGHTIGSRLRAGAHLYGWVSQKYDLHDPRTGEGVGVVGGSLDAFPLGRVPLFFRGGIGEAFYEYDKSVPAGSDPNVVPVGHSGQGLGWEAGGGYEFHLVPEFLAFAPMVEYAAGNRGDVLYSNPPEIGRRYSVVEFKLGITFKWGTIRKQTHPM